MSEEDKNLIETIENAKKGDSQALVALYREFYPRILKFMYYRVNHNSAEDLTSEVFLRVVRSLQSQRGNFTAWIYRIARNIIIDKYRSLGAKPEEKLDPQGYQLINTPDDNVENPDNVLDVEEALEHLDDEQREIVTLRFIQGYSCKEVAEILGKSSGAVRIAQYRALQKLKSVLGGKSQV